MQFEKVGSAGKFTIVEIKPQPPVEKSKPKKEASQNDIPAKPYNLVQCG